MFPGLCSWGLILYTGNIVVVNFAVEFLKGLQGVIIFQIDLSGLP